MRRRRSYVVGESPSDSSPPSGLLFWATLYSKCGSYMGVPRILRCGGLQGLVQDFFYKRGGLATVGVPRKSHTGSRGNALVGDLEDEVYPISWNTCEISVYDF